MRKRGHGKTSAGGQKKGGLLGFKEYGDRRPSTNNVAAELVEVALGDPFPIDADLRIFVWSEGKSGPLVLTEVVGNKNIKLVAQYTVRYDSPRSASTGRQQTPKGDWHLFDKSKEIAAWDSEGLARHGFAQGTKIPKKAYDALIKKHPSAVGLKGRLLEEIINRQGGTSLLVEEA
jgi:hypothetical protein